MIRNNFVYLHAEDIIYMMYNPLKPIADDIEIERMNANRPFDKAQPHKVTERLIKNYSLGDVRRRLLEQELTD